MQWTLAIFGGAFLLYGVRNWTHVANGTERSRTKVNQTVAVIGALCIGLGNVIAVASGLGWPSAAPAASANSRETCLCVCTFNVQTTNRNYAEIEQLLLASDADVIVIPELGSGLEQHLSAAFAMQYKWSRTDPRDGGNFGIGIYSRLPWISATLFTLNGNIPSVEAHLKVAGQSYAVIGTHTVPPMGRRGFEHRNTHLAMLADRVHEISRSSPQASVIVAGDFNVTPWSPVFQHFCDDAGLVRNAGGIKPTWYRFSAFPFGLVLDHILTTPDLRALAHEIGDGAGSDHRIVTARFARTLQSTDDDEGK